MADYANWLTKQQTATAIGVSTKGVERFEKAGRLQKATRPAKGSPDVVVYHPDDVARLAKARQREAAPFVVPAVGNGNGDHLVTAGDQLVTKSHIPGVIYPEVKTEDGLVRALFAAAVQQVLSQTSQTPTLFLTLAEASTVSGLSVRCLRRLIVEQKLAAVRDRGWRIRRRDLEQL